VEKAVAAAGFTSVLLEYEELFAPSPTPLIADVADPPDPPVATELVVALALPTFDSFVVNTGLLVNDRLLVLVLEEFPEFVRLEFPLFFKTDDPPFAVAEPPEAVAAAEEFEFAVCD
jgi:hypothetical protein